MRGAAVSGVFLLASWRVGFSLFLWIATIFLILLIFKCLKSLALAIKDQGALYLRDQSIGSSGRSRGRRRTSLPLYSSVCRPAQRRSLRTSAWLAILGSGPPSPRGRPRDQVYTVRGHRSAARSDRRSQRPQPGSHRPQVDSDLEYLPPNTPMQTPPLEPPPYSALSNERTEEPPPAYDSLYPAKESQQGVPPV